MSKSIRKQLWGLLSTPLLLVLFGLLFVMHDAVHAQTPLYSYDARKLTASPVTAWNDAIGIATNERNWELPGGTKTTLVSTSHPVLTQTIQFDGTQIRGDIHTSTFGNSDFTSGTDGRNTSFEIWFQPTSTGVGQVLFETGAQGAGAALKLEAGGTMTFLTRRSGTNINVSSTATASTSDFTQLVGVVDETNNRTRIYVNGVEQGTGTIGTRD